MFDSSSRRPDVDCQSTYFRTAVKLFMDNNRYPYPCVLRSNKTVLMTYCNQACYGH